MAKLIRDLEELMVDHYGDLHYKSGTSKHPSHDVILQLDSYEICVL